MPVNINVIGESAAQALNELKTLSAGLLGTTAPAAPVAPPPPPAQPEPEPAPAPAAEDKPKRGRGKKSDNLPAPEPEKAEHRETFTLDVDDMRACITLLCGGKGSAEARELLTKFKVKRVSEIDSGQYHDFVAATAALFDVNLDATVRAMKATRLLGELAEGDEKDAFVEKFGGEGALTMTDEDFAALQKAAG